MHQHVALQHMVEVRAGGLPNPQPQARTGHRTTVNLMAIPDFQTMMRPVLVWQLREMNRNRLHRSGT